MDGERLTMAQRRKPTNRGGNEPRPFRGFQKPNYTMVPDELFDDLLADLRAPEVKALLYIVRRTFGFKRDSDSISINQMLEGITAGTARFWTGHETSCSTSHTLKSLGKGTHHLRRRSSPTGSSTIYRLNVIGYEPEGVRKPGCPSMKIQQGVENRTPLVRQSN